MKPVKPDYEDKGYAAILTSNVCCCWGCLELKGKFSKHRNYSIMDNPANDEMTDLLMARPHFYEMIL